ncbi:hypothetical protein AVEN_235379-2 [Araneus ventricosus]|uniref:Uncharacterized protein n=1 Tax=Araneus ventricosus TaxID=182803 RepID=A0A4Y2A3J8_ARAVE|nr:hypothetical protein AVEN_235379-2 [Araneus ventricosus]
MMESLLKKSYGYTKKKASERVSLEALEDKPSANCNICRNFSNIFDRSHRLSTSHQNKLTERFRIIRSKMKMIRYDSIAVHDAEWGSEEDLWCYFCDKSVKKNQIYEGCTIEYLGYLTHLTDGVTATFASGGELATYRPSPTSIYKAHKVQNRNNFQKKDISLLSSQHIEAVKSYLKYHGRKEKFELFCKTKADLEKFLGKIPEVKNKYLAKMNFIHEKDVAHIKEVEAERQLLVSEAIQVPITINRNEASTSGNEGSSQQASTLPQNISRKRNANINPKPKMCPWLVESEKECNDQQVPKKPVIGPTIDTLKKHVADQKKKLLPMKRLGANFQRKQVYSSHWLPSFSGVWNKGRHRQMKSNGKHTR